MRRARAAALLILLLLGVGIAIAGNNQQGQPGSVPNVVAGGDYYDIQAPGAAGYVRTVTTADAADFPTMFAAVKASGGIFGVYGRQSIPVSPRFSVPGASCSLRWTYIWDPHTKSSDITLSTLSDNSISFIVTFTSSINGNTDPQGHTYSDADWTFPGLGAPYGIAWIQSVSAGTVYLRIGSS